MRSYFLAAHPSVNDDGNYDGSSFEQRLRDRYIPGVETFDRCHVCGNGSLVRLRYPAKFRAQEDIYLRNEAISQHLHMCATCGLIFSRKALAPDFYFEYLNTAYANASFPKSPEAIAQNEASYRIKHRFAWRSVEPKGRVLEISSFWGTGLADLADRCDVWGLEAENVAARFSVDHYPKLRGRIVNDVLENGLAQLRKVGPFDRILMSYAFRHMPRPRLVLEWLADVVAPGGYVLFTEGTWSDFIFAEPRSAQAIHFFHNKANYYNLSNLDRLMAAYGFRLVRSDFQGRGGDAPTFDQSIAIFGRDPDRRLPRDLPHTESKALSLAVWEQFIRAQ